MQTWVALLRGINLAGVRPVPMADLRELVASLGHEDVTTHLASGNVVFGCSDGRRTARSLGEELRGAIEERFEPGIPVVVRPGADLVRIEQAGHPLARRGDAAKFHHVIFLDTPVAAEDVAALDHARWGDDELTGEGHELFVRYAHGSHRSKLTLDRLERDLGVTATARNWNTVARLADMVRASAD